MIFRGNRFLCVFIFFVLSTTKMYAQDTVVLEAIECAIVKLHIVDDCPCSYFTLEELNGKVVNERLILVSIDSVILIHTDDDFIDNEFLINNIRYLFLSDNFRLHRDTSYIASVGLEYDMNYVILVELYDNDLVYLEIPNGRLGDFARNPGPEQSPSCLNNWNQIKKSIDECNTKYRLKVNYHHNLSD